MYLESKPLIDSQSQHHESADDGLAEIRPPHTN